MEIIMTNIEFLINDYNGTGDDYQVVAYAQDIEESDMYDIDIYKIHNYDESSHEVKEIVSTLYADSCGGCLEYEVPGAKLTELEEYVLNILFSEQHKGIIRGF